MRQASGLTLSQIKKLLILWKKQGRACTYCDQPATTIDHVIPLALGGSNREGNLTPACRDCNSRKNDSLLIEWRHKKRVRRERIAVDATPHAKPIKVKRWADDVPMFNVCPGCGDLTSGRAQWCSVNCNMRTAYRRKVGIPDRAPLWNRAA